MYKGLQSLLAAVRQLRHPGQAGGRHQLLRPFAFQFPDRVRFHLGQHNLSETERMFDRLSEKTETGFVPDQERMLTVPCISFGFSVSSKGLFPLVFLKHSNIENFVPNVYARTGSAYRMCGKAERRV